MPSTLFARRRPAPLWLLLSLAAAANLPSHAQAPQTPQTPQTPAQPPAAAHAASAPGRAASAPGRVAPAPGRSASAPAAAASAAAAGADASATGQRIEITGSRLSDTEERRRSTAAKIVIGREEIDKFGDATVGEVLRRLPGVTTPGAPGRGGPPRMRGLGNGFTQLLIDGQRIPPGFSLESLSPEQIERIEILRAPTAETGARAIAGTINIITREGFKKRLNDVRIGLAYENGKFAPGATWTHNDSIGDLIYNLSGSAFRPQRESSNQTRTTVTGVDTGAPLEDRTSNSTTTESRIGANLTGRLQWRLGDSGGSSGGSGSGDMLTLTPVLFHGSGSTDTRYTLRQLPLRPVCAPGQVDNCMPQYYDYGNTHGDNSFTNTRLGALWRQRVAGMRLETGATLGGWHSSNNSVRRDFLVSAGAAPQRTLDDRSSARERSALLTVKGSALAGGSEAGGGEHSLVAGGEIDASRRNDTRVQLQDGAPQLGTDFGDNLQASALRVAAYVQDEWAVNPNWAASAGLRWEGIGTRGDTGQIGGVLADSARPSNRSSVWTPLFHAVWKPDPKSRDQVRVSLTRSYRSPPLGSLIAKPSINRNFSTLPGPNRESDPDSAGNPNLKPELATGVDLAVERYLEGGGVLSGNLFHRNIRDLMRSRTELENVPYSPGQPRYVRRQRNIGDATTSGLELEAKFRLDQAITGALPVELRSNVAFYTSRVKSVPGPDNRLDQQAKGTANFGGDYRLRSIPLTLGGNLNLVPGTTTRLDVDQTVTVSSKRVWDMFALWTFNPQVGLRLLGSNLLARDYATTNVNDSSYLNTVTPPAAPGSAGTRTERITSFSQGPSYINWQLRLELKL